MVNIGRKTAANNWLFSIVVGNWFIHLFCRQYDVCIEHNVYYKYTYNYFEKLVGRAFGSRESLDPGTAGFYERFYLHLSDVTHTHSVA